MSKPTLNSRARAHLGGRGAPQVITRSFPDYLAGDVAIACKEYLDQLTAPVVRFAGEPAALLEPCSAPVAVVGAPMLEQFEVPGGPARQGLRQGLALLRFETVPMIAYCRWETQPREFYAISVLAHDLERAQRFLRAFSAFAESRRAITSPLFARVAGSLNTRLRAHLGDGPSPGIVTHTFPQYQIANVAIQVKDFFDGLRAEFTGVGRVAGLSGFGKANDLLALLEPAVIDRFGHFEGHDQTAATFEQITIEPGTTRLGLRDGIVVFRFDDVPMFASCSRVESVHGEYRLTVAARDLAKANHLLETFLQYESAHSILRGRLLRPEIDYGSQVKAAEILTLDDVSWDRVVLPDPLRHRVERDVLGYIRAADTLADNAIDPRRCFLFHGPPGTGKTFLCKLLASELQGFTSILITGMNLQHPAPAFALARALAPALLFFEDVDLVARDRDANPFPAALGELLNQLDGLCRGERIYVVFTTNRLDLLEEALAQRPGRVDMIIRLPPPEAALRRRLIRIYTGTALVQDADVEWLVERTDGVTPAFLREFTKELVFAAIHARAVDERGRVTVEHVHFEETFERLAEIRRDHNADRILGFRA